MTLLTKRFAKSRVEKSPSIESCFPAVRSAEYSGSESPEDYEININMEHSHDDINHEDSTCLDNFEHGISPASSSVKYPIASAVPPGISTPSPSISDIQNSPQQLQNVSNLTTILEVTGSNAQSILSPSTRLDSLGYHSMTQSAKDVKPSTQAANDFASFPLATVTHSGAISGEMRGLKAYVTLFLAALKGDWEKAKNFLDLCPQAMRARITRGSETALHIAAGARHTRFVEELVNLMTSDDLALQNKVGNTALCFAAASGVTRIAKVMVNKNKNLPLIRGSKGALPLYMAAILGHRDMVWYLYSITEGLTDEDLIGLLIAAITANLFGLLMELPSNYPSSYRSHGKLIRLLLHVVPILKVLLWKVLTFLVPGFKVIYDKKLMQIQALELVKRLWNQVLLLDDSEFGDLIRTPTRLLFTAAELGIVEFVIVLIRSYPDLIWKVDDKSRSIFHIAVAHRQENIFNLIYEIGAHKDLIAAYKDENNNNMLHLAGKLAPPNRLKTDSGAALQLRRELHWFKEVEKIVQPLYTEMRDSEGRTPQVVFTEEHKSLVYEGEKWMKDTASSCMVVATLIATVMFAAAFTVPGGDNDNTGSPNFILKKSFLVFAVSDALALFSSATSILMFLSILTSRYAEEDFLDSLPNRLVMGLATLFISIATMMISFCATLFIVLSQGLDWIGIPMALVASVPVILFALLQFPLFVDVISHTYRSSTIFGPRNYLLC
ncbi:ankyrin repeat-containing protein ITN1-like isoform X4 [Cornus florida]|uniref:ankyrin repeat-containing protein ITN1-like isoform X4 n=1 Tax=Cornus florida TaxID=4283 RepID=UPI00289FE5DA|nr:ankyrin repeat-containing protein ITN1-like isoform X4 [Cornus florida]